MNEYTIHGGDEGKKRLEILSRTIAPGTERFLKSAHIQAGMHCLDLGCGGGDVTLAIAQLVGVNGHVTGLDIDERKIQLAIESAERKQAKNVRFQAFNAYDLKEVDAFDVIYSRFLLSHLKDPEIVLQKMRQALRPNGTLLIEDTDFSGHFSHPVSSAFNRYVSLYQRLLKKRGADANLGQKLVGLLKKHGFEDVELQISQPAHMEGEGKLMAEITLEGISKALVEEGLVSAHEVEKIHSGIVRFRERGDSLMSLPRIFQVRGTAVDNIENL